MSLTPPQRIWLLDYGSPESCWCDCPDPDYEERNPVEYVRATQLEAMQAEIDRLNAEIARLRNIMNEDGLHDPELAKLAGKRRDALEASNEQGGRKFRASLDRQGK